MKNILAQCTLILWLMVSYGVTEDSIEKVHKTKEEWAKILTPAQFRILRENGTERPFTGKYYNFKGNGVYQCAACSLDLFNSDTKYNSRTGWPSFWAAIEGHVGDIVDNRYGMKRTEVICNRCDSHLGHVFSDGPLPTGLRYCINSLALQFVPISEEPLK